MSIARPSTAQGALRASRSLSEELVDALIGLGVKAAYGIVGGSIAPFCDALARSGMRILHCRHESGAAFAALEDSLAEDCLSLVFVSAGPGVTNVITGLYSARVEGARVLLVSGGTSSFQRGRGASQETTAATMPSGLLLDGPLFHHAATIEHPAELATVMRRISAGLAAPEGFVAHIHLPLSLQTTPSEGRLSSHVPAFPALLPHEDVVGQVARILVEERCALWVGFGARRAAGLVRALAERHSLPVLCSPRGKGIFPEDHPLFLGVTGVGGHAVVPGRLAELGVRRTLVLGTRLWECTSFWKPELVPPGGLVHVDMRPEVFGAAYPWAETMGINAEIGAFLSALLARLPEPAREGVTARRVEGRAALEPRAEGMIRPRFLFEAIQRVVVESTDAVVLTEAGSAFLWGSHVLRFREPGRYRSGMHFGSMGHATTGVVGVVRSGRRRAVAIVGDGAMLMHGEVSTAVRYGFPAVWIVLNDRRYGVVEHGMRASGFEPVETALPDTDFALVARGVGALGARVDREAELEAAIVAALDAERPFVLDVLIDPSERAPISSRIRSLKMQGMPDLEEGPST